jgi:hypothetical protein
VRERITRPAFFAFHSAAQHHALQCTISMRCRAAGDEAPDSGLI